jgi:hypothetical protein
LRGDGELRATIRTYYGARSAMLMLFVGILFGLALGTSLVRKAFLIGGPQRWILAAGAAGIAFLIPVLVAFTGARVVHLFSRSCRKKPIQANEIRVVRVGRPAAQSGSSARR